MRTYHVTVKRTFTKTYLVTAPTRKDAHHDIKSLSDHQRAMSFDVVSDHAEEKITHVINSELLPKNNANKTV
jgi:5-enolpyruvylshikimate-3-phosphate synthase